MMRNLFPAIACSVAVLALAACGDNTTDSASERPNDKGLNAEQLAARATTPQASMTPAEREEFRGHMKSLLDEVGGDRAEGHVQVGEDEVVAMQPLQVHDFTTRMTAGTPYLVFAVCDGDCEVVDIALLNSAGQVIKSDTDSGDFPVVDLTPETAGAYTVRITMTECKLAPCYAGARVYRRA